MTSRDFAYWLMGLFELSNPPITTLDQTQTDLIKRHLALVFIHEIDPSMSDDPIKQEQMNEVHHGPSPHEGWELGLHGWYDPKMGQPRC